MLPGTFPHPSYLVHARTFCPCMKHCSNCGRFNSHISSEHVESEAFHIINSFLLTDCLDALTQCHNVALLYYVILYLLVFTTVTTVTVLNLLATCHHTSCGKMFPLDLLTGFYFGNTSIICFNFIFIYFLFICFIFYLFMYLFIFFSFFIN